MIIDRDCPWFTEGYKLGLTGEPMEIPEEDMSDQEADNYRNGYELAYAIYMQNDGM